MTNDKRKGIKEKGNKWLRAKNRSLFKLESGI